MWRSPFPIHFAALLLLPCFSVVAADPLLPPAYQPGREYLIRSSQHAETVVGFAGETQAKQVADIEMEVRAVCQLDKSDAKFREVVVEMLAIKMNVRLGGVEMRYDSREADSGKTLLGQTFSPLIGKSFAVTMDEAGEIVATRGMEQFATGDNLLAQQFGPEQLKQIATPALRLGFPAKGAVIGETWKQTREILLGPEQRLAASFDVRYARDELLENRSHGVIEYGAGIDADLRTAAGEGKAPFTNVQIRKGRLNGVISIDKELRFPRSGMAMTTMTMVLPDPANPENKVELPVEQSLNFELLSTRRLGLFERP